MKNKSIDAPLEVMMLILPRDSSGKVIDILEKKECKNNLLCYATGTAKNRRTDFFGFGITERELIVSVVPHNLCDELINMFDIVLKLDQPHSGAVITIPISSATSAMLDAMGINY